MEIRDYVLSEEELKKIEKKQNNRKRLNSRKRTSYEILFQSGCDFGIKKQTGTKSEELIILVSKRQYYIKAGLEIKKLNIGMLKNFLKKLDGVLMLPEVSWLTGVEGHPDFCSRLGRTIFEKGMTPFLQKGTLYVYTEEERIRICSQDELRNMMPVTRFMSFNLFYETMGNTMSDRSLLDETSVKMWQWTLEHLSECRNISVKEMFRNVLFYNNGKKETLILMSLQFFSEMTRFYGSEWVKKAVDVFRDSNLESPFFNIRELQKLIAVGAGCNNMIEYANLKKSPFGAKAFLDYLICHAAGEGFAMNVNDFVSYWAEDLALQKRFYGKIREKYPKHLLSELNVLRYKNRIYNNELDKKSWEEAVENMMTYEYSGEDYVIICPKTKEDIFYEAAGQCNCLADYTNKIVRKEEMILFMRRKDAPQEPLITIELFNNRDIGQIFGKFNRSPENAEMDFIRNWAEEKNLKVPENPCPPRAAEYWTDDFNDDDPFGDVVPFGTRQRNPFANINNGPFSENSFGNPFDDTLDDIFSQSELPLVLPED